MRSTGFVLSLELVYKLATTDIICRYVFLRSALFLKSHNVSLREEEFRMTETTAMEKTFTYVELVVW